MAALRTPDAAELLYELTGQRLRRAGAGWAGLPGWCVRIERHPTAPLGLVAEQWWPQTVREADEAGLVPLLLYRPHRGPWRAVWPAALHCEPFPVIRGCHFGGTLTAEPLTWWRMVKAWHFR